MDRLSGECIFSNLGKMVYGPGKVAEVGNELARLGGDRAILVTGRSLGKSPLLDRVKQAMGHRCVGVFQGIIQHGAEDSAEALAAQMRRLDADSVVSFGGSSASDTAKVAVAAVLSGRRVEDMATMELFDIVELGEVTRRIPHVCLPTTLSAGEYTPGGGATDRQGLKGAVMNPVLQIDVIINDPELSVDTSDELWTSTGIRALDHIVEAFYSQHSQSFTDALAAKAAELLFEHLPASVNTEGEARIAHRGHCLTAAWLSNYAAMNTRYGVSHAVGHKMGPMWNVPHGITSCVSLPFAMRFMATHHPERFEKLAAALKVPFDAAEPRTSAAGCIARVEGLIASLGLPRSISALGIPKDEIDRVTSHIRYEINLLDTVGRPVTDAEVSELLNQMYLARNSDGAEVEPLIAHS